MRIERVEFLGLRSPLAEPAVFAWGQATQRNVGLVRIETDRGTSGWGETSVTFPLWSLEERAATVAGLASMIEGSEIEHPTHIDALITGVGQSTDALRRLWSPVALSAGIGAIEMALWDAWGKEHDRPVWELLGGKRGAVPLYAVGFVGGPNEIVQQAIQAVEQGYQTVKIRVGMSEEADTRLLARLWEELGPGILLDANMAWDVQTATRMAKAFEPFSPGWLEEPLAPRDLAGARTLSQHTTIPLAGGENCFSAPELTELASSRAVSVVMPDVARIGGLRSALNGTRSALGLGVGYSPHHYASDVGFAASLTLCAVLGVSRPMLRDLSDWPLRADILAEPLEIGEGWARPWPGAGLSPPPRDSVLERWRVI